VGKTTICRTYRYPSGELLERVPAAVKKRGFRSDQAFLIAACEQQLREGDNTEATTQLEACIAASLANVAKELQSLFTLAHTEFALTNFLLQYALTCMVEPPEDVLTGARARRAQHRKWRLETKPHGRRYSAVAINHEKKSIPPAAPANQKRSAPEWVEGSLRP
jgi:hypothetical protein